MKKICIILFALSLCSCTYKGHIYFITDKYTEEIIDKNIIEEISETAEKNSYKFNYYRAGSEKEINSVLDSISLSEENRVVITPFAYLNYYPGKREIKNNLFLIGPYFDFNRSRTEISSNIRSLSGEIFSSLSAEKISFYIDDSEKSFPELEIIESIQNSAKSLNDNPLYVTINNISDLKPSGFDSSGEDEIAVIIPESVPDNIINSLSEIKSRYILYDFANLSSLKLLSSAAKPLFVLRYDYKQSFEAVLAYKKNKQGGKTVYSCYFEKK